MAHPRSDTPSQALPGEDGSANTSVPTQALPGIIYTAEITFYIATDAATDVAKVVIYKAPLGVITKGDLVMMHSYTSKSPGKIASLIAIID